MASTNVASNAFVREVLDQHNYEDWSSRVETYLLAEDLWDVVNTEPPNKPQGLEGEAEYKAWTTKNTKALHAIKNSCGTQLFSFIRDTRTAKIAWEVLETQFKLPDTLRLEKKAREEREISLRTPMNVAGQTSDERKDLVQANEAVEIKPAEGELERETTLHIRIDARQTRDAVEELVPTDDDEELQIKANEGGNENNLNYKYDSSYDPFFTYVIDGDWDHANKCLATLHPDAIRARRPHDGCNALHCAAWKGHMHIIKELTSLMTQEDLEIKNDDGHIALHAAIERGNVDIVKELVSSMREEALEIKDAFDMTPPAWAIHVSHFGVDEGDVIKMITCMLGKNKKFPSSVIGYDNFKPVVEASAWETWKLTRYLYSITPLEDLIPPENGSHGASLIWYCLYSKEFDIARHLLSRCSSLTTLETITRNGSPIVSLGRVHSAFLRDMRFKFWQKWIYDRIRIQPSADSDILEISINVSNSEDVRGNQRGLISSVMSLLRRLVKGLLELLGNLSPQPQFNSIQGASLQMQRELQWFQEVRSFVPLKMHESRNTSENLTARELFHKNHKKLMEEAELSMKGMATSCTVVGALIVTIMFAAAFTIPGGINGNTGLPMFIDENLFLVFIVSDTTALVSSTTAVIIFLEILTSRYSEDDYLKNLPIKMMIGVFILFISIATMMSAFCCGLVIMLQERYSWVAIPSILVASIPVISFMWKLFPLLLQTFISTYGSGIFNKRVKPWI